MMNNMFSTPAVHLSTTQIMQEALNTLPSLDKMKEMNLDNQCLSLRAELSQAEQKWANDMKSMLKRREKAEKEIAATEKIHMSIGVEKAQTRDNFITKCQKLQKEYEYAQIIQSVKQEIPDITTTTAIKIPQLPDLDAATSHYDATFDLSDPVMILNQVPDENLMETAEYMQNEFFGKRSATTEVEEEEGHKVKRVKTEPIEEEESFLLPDV